MTRITEQNLVLPSLFLMKISNDGFISTTELKEKLALLLKPTGEDAMTSPSRPGEIKFMQIVGNLKSHDTFERNGYAKHEQRGGIGGFSITPSGLLFLEKNEGITQYLLSNDFEWEDLKKSLVKVEKGIEEDRKFNIFDENLLIVEGVRKVKTSTTYERSKKLRDYAIDYFSRDDQIWCHCCLFNFETFYGKEIGTGFIEIHHKHPIFQYENDNTEKTIADAMSNLIPLCANCHRMIHRNRGKNMEISELRDVITAHGVFS